MNLTSFLYLILTQFLYEGFSYWHQYHPRITLMGRWKENSPRITVDRPPTSRFSSLTSEESHSEYSQNVGSQVVLGQASSAVGAIKSNEQKSRIQALDYTTLFLSVEELNSQLVPGKVENVLQEDSYNLYLELKTADGNSSWLHICWHAELAHLGIGLPPPRAETLPFSLAQTMRGILKGLMVVNVSIMCPWNRIVAIDFNDRVVSLDDGNIGQKQEFKWRLIFEVMGARSNVILVSGQDESIQACGYQVSSSSSQRPLQTNLKYVLPPIGGGIYDPTTLFPETLPGEIGCNTFVDALRTQVYPQGSVIMSLDKALVKLFKGLSPNIATMLVQNSNIGPADKLNESNWSTQDPAMKCLFLGFLAWIQLFTGRKSKEGTLKIEGNPYSFLVQPHFIKSMYVPIQLISAKGISESNVPSDHCDSRQISSIRAPITQFIKSYYSQRQRLELFDTQRRICDRKLQMLQRRTQKLMNEFKGQLHEARGGKAEDLKYRGDLITSYLYSWDGSSTNLNCVDFITGDDVIIAIPMHSSPAEYSQQLYKKAKKLKKSIDIVDTLMNKTTTLWNYLDEIASSLTNIEKYESYYDIITMREIEDELDAIGANSVLYYFANGGDRIANDDGSKKSAASGAGKGSKKAGNGGKQSSSSNSKTSQKKSTNKQSTSSTPISKKKIYQGLLMIDPQSSILLDESKKMDLMPSDTNVPLPRLLVGRNSKQNDRITFGIAKEHHVWFHVQGSPGSHCLLLLNPGEVVSEAALQYAADVAAYHSKARGSTQVPVMHCSPKFIKKISGGSLGTVSILQQQGVVYGRPDRGIKLISQYGIFPQD